MQQALWDTTDAIAAAADGVALAPTVPSDFAERVGPFHILPRRLGHSCKARVFDARHLPTGQQVAVRIVNKRKLVTELCQRRVQRSVRVQQALHSEAHPVVCKVLSIHECAEKVYVFQERASGNLLEHLRKQGVLAERYSKPLAFRLFDAVARCHQKGIVHRNLSLDHVLLVTEGGEHPEHPQVRLTGFAYSNQFSSEELIASVRRAPHFSSPEVILGADPETFDPSAVDAWSLGVILFVLACGRLPFSHHNPNTLCNMIVAAPHPTVATLSRELQDLIGRLLDKQPSSRWTVQQALRHPWFDGLAWSGTHARKQTRELDAVVTQELTALGFALGDATDGGSKDGRSYATAKFLLANKLRAECANAEHQVPGGEHCGARGLQVVEMADAVVPVLSAAGAQAREDVLVPGDDNDWEQEQNGGHRQRGTKRTASMMVEVELPPVPVPFWQHQMYARQHRTHDADDEEGDGASEMDDDLLDAEDSCGEASDSEDDEGSIGSGDEDHGDEVEDELAFELEQEQEQEQEPEQGQGQGERGLHAGSEMGRLTGSDRGISNQEMQVESPQDVIGSQESSAQQDPQRIRRLHAHEGQALHQHEPETVAVDVSTFTSAAHHLVSATRRGHSRRRRHRHTTKRFKLSPEPCAQQQHLRPITNNAALN